ncbi:hypothetical protein QBC46DRAFT_53612 [Diplogelasinospora grovesii]|uniref:Zn(2)-C6 fungal-type domain-containing protein n=1 Tax=Diplogelasinospora grovesii TaxID=303347 RepID=A0AAN6NCM7_9PEZI|nr:hypothetical protein QBC46DRAFT_53612 [Diplogelasinospora grovesii]
MAESSQSPPAVGQDTPGPTRIRRNTACVRCRDAKVKCNASLTPNQPCLRCSKLELHCVVDKSHKRTSRRSKLEELAAELANIKEAVVAPRQQALSVAAPELPPIVCPLQLPSPQSLSQPSQAGDSSFVPPGTFTRVNPFTPQGAEPSPTVITSALSSGLAAATAVPPPAGPLPGPSGRPAEPRALRSQVFSGDDIDYYFERYFEHFHPYLPIVRTRDPDTCYKRGPVLFWAVILTACRRYARDDSVFQFLVDSLLPEIWNAVSQPPLRLPVINALLLLATWPNPTIRFLSDPSLIFAGIAMNSAFLTGLHTGRGSHSEFKGPSYRQDTTDEEATFTWAGCAIISHRVAAYMGCPSAGSLFNRTIDKLLDGSSPFPIPRYFAIHLETSRFANRISRTMCASLEEAQGVSHHLVAHMEEEYTKVQRLLYPENSDLDNFTLLSTLLEIQIYYFMPLPNFSEEILKRNVIKCYTTAESLIHSSLKLHRETAFLHYAPHFVFRTLLSAACVILSVHLSSYTKGFQADTVDSLIKDAIRAMRICSVQDGDLHMRGTNMLEKYWTLRAHIPNRQTRIAGVDDDGMGISIFTHRLGASLTFDCLRRWKKDVEYARDASNTTPNLAPGTEPPQEGLRAGVGPNMDLGLTEPYGQRATTDWNAFMDDFDWSFTSNYLPIT